MRTLPLSLLALGFAVGCATTDDDSDTGLDSDTDTGSDTSDTSETGDTDNSVPDSPLSGTLVDVDGNPVAGVRMQACTSLACLPATGLTGADGKYWFPTSLQPKSYALEAVPPHDGSLVTALTVYPLAEGQHTLDIVLLDDEDEDGIPATSREVALTDTLHVTLGSDDLSIPFGGKEVAAGVDVPADARMPIDVPGTHVMVFYVEPFDAETPSGAGFPWRITPDAAWGLVEGDPVQVWLAVYPDGVWDKVADATYAAGVIEAPGENLPSLSTILLVKPD